MIQQMKQFLGNWLMAEEKNTYPRRIEVCYCGTDQENQGVALLLFGAGMRGPRWQSTILLSELKGTKAAARKTIITAAFNKAMDKMELYTASERNGAIRDAITLVETFLRKTPPDLPDRLPSNP